MPMKKTAIFLLTILSIQLQAQSGVNSEIHSDSQKNLQTSEKWNVGLELDVLPYATGGYFGAAWVGKNKWRSRVLVADVNMPDIITKEGFTNHHIHSYAVILDRFLDDNWKGWWIGAGPVYWKSKIQSDAGTATKNFENLLLNGSLGYNFQVYKNIYVSPWAGLSLKVSGDDEFILDNKEYKLPLLNPELSVKFGLYF